MHGGEFGDKPGRLDGCKSYGCNSSLPITRFLIVSQTCPSTIQIDSGETVEFTGGKGNGVSVPIFW